MTAMKLQLLTDLPSQVRLCTKLLKGVFCRVAVTSKFGNSPG